MTHGPRSTPRGQVCGGHEAAFGPGRGTVRSRLPGHRGSSVAWAAGYLSRRGGYPVSARTAALLGALLAGVLAAAAAPPRVERDGARLRFTNAHYAITLGLAPGVGWERIDLMAVPESAGRSVLSVEAPARVFEVGLRLPGRAEAVRLDSRQFEVRDVRLDEARGTCVIDLAAGPESGGLEARLAIALDDTCRSVWALSLRAPGGAVAEVVLPILEDLVPGGRVEDIGYFFPRDPGLMNSAPARLLTTYGQYATSQLVCVFSESWGPAGGGVTCIWQDTSLHRRSFELVKVDPAGPPPLELADRYGFPYWDRLAVHRGVGVAACLPNVALPAGETVTLAPFSLGIHAGGWRQAFREYRSWVRTWYREQHPPALARFFTFASYHGYEKCTFWAPSTAEAAIAGIPERVDQLHFIAQKEDRYGVYDVYREDWGLDGLRRFVEAAHARGKLCSHYIQGTVAHQHSAVYREHGDEWGQKGPDGTTLEAWGNQCMCLAAEGWAGWLAETAARLVRDLDLDIAYLDCVGWTTLDKFQCHNPQHPHQPACHEMADVRRLFGTVKEAIAAVKPQAALTTEGPLADLFFNDVDGNEGYGIRFLHEPAYGVPVHFMRFLYPRFKYLDLETETPERVKMVLFNATATAADPAVIPEAGLAWRVFHEHAAVFTEGDPEPHLPTREPGVFCNRFVGRGKSLYTVWNSNSYPAAGAFVPVEVPAGSHVVDLLRDREALRRRIGGREHLVTELKPRDAGVFGVLPAWLSAAFDGMWLRAQRSDPGQTGRLTALRVDDADLSGPPAGIPLPAGEAVDFVALSERGARRVVLRLDENGEVLDELELPRLEDLDLAAAAAASASNEGVAHGAQPGSVLGRNGSWRLTWDDQPRPGWVELVWERPQTLNCVAMAFERPEYAPREAEVLVADGAGAWVSVLRGTSEQVSGIPFSPVTTRRLRVVFHQGGVWANLVSLIRLQVQYRPVPASP